jgi:magnesium chelatase subunit I
MSQPRTLGELRVSKDRSERVSVREEMRCNLLRKLQTKGPVFPGIVGYDDSVIPQITNAVLSKHNMILLGLRGQAKSRILRSLTGLLDPLVPVVAGCEINDHPEAPLCRRCRDLIAAQRDETPVAWLTPGQRYVEKLATPDVTIADIIGDVDPIRAARGGFDLASELTMHYGLLPRAHRGIFALNELPDLAARIQVGLFNILQEGDVQIKGYPVRLPIDVSMVFTANPEDYTARGKIITPLKDRIGSEVRTHYPTTLEHGVAITSQEAWTSRGTGLLIPRWVREVVEAVAFAARREKKIDRRSGVSQRLPISALENAVSNAERRALVSGEDQVVPRVSDIYASLPSLTGKIELEYEGELKGAESVAKELVRQAVATVFDGHAGRADTAPVVGWFDRGGSLDLSDTSSAADLLDAVEPIDGFSRVTAAIGARDPDADPLRASVADFVLEGLCALKKISRSEDGRLLGSPTPQRVRAEPRNLDQLMEDDEPTVKGKKKYYN